MKRLKTTDDTARACPTDLALRRVPDARTAARAVEVLRALGDPTRFRIFSLVASRPEPICVCDIVARFELRQPTISHHLKVLLRAGLVSVERRGTWAWYGVDPTAEGTVRRILDATFPGGPDRPDRPDCAERADPRDCPVRPGRRVRPDRTTRAP